jgi:DNA-binding SARP family transcriptional activator
VVTKQAMLSKKESPLLDYAISKLTPEVFSHPVWVWFGNHGDSNAARIIEDLLNEAQKLQNDNPSDACQLMLICCVFQNYANQHQNALATIQHTLALAKRTGLTRELLWANWGASAICIQHGNYERAVSYLDELEASLSIEKEWVLADFVDIIKQSLYDPTKVGTKIDEKISSDSPADDLIHLTFLWIQQWGSQVQFSKAKFSAISKSSVNSVSINPQKIRLLFSTHYWQNYWRIIRLIFKEKFSIFHTSSLPSSRSSQKNQRQTNQSATNIPDDPISHLKNTRAPTTVSITVRMLGHFNLAIQDLTIKLPTSRSLSLLKYLLMHHKQDTPREVLMDIFWPDADPEAARNNLNVAIHGLRSTFRHTAKMPIILFSEGGYQINPDFELRIDVNEFEHYQFSGRQFESSGSLQAAISEYEIAAHLYQGDFLEEDLYEDWPIMIRERLRLAYIDMLDRLSHIYFNQKNLTACAATCQRILERDNCRENTHCLLMHCYCQQGQDYLALRQYQACAAALKSELDAEPAPSTKALAEKIKHHESI